MKTVHVISRMTRNKGTGVASIVTYDVMPYGYESAAHAQRVVDTLNGAANSSKYGITHEVVEVEILEEGRD